jgi:hypothetical protein
VELPTIVPDSWSLVMSIGDYSPWVLVDELLVKSLGFTKAYNNSQCYIQLHLFLLDFPDTFIIDIIIGGDRQWQRTLGVGRKRPPDGSDFITYNRIWEEHQRQPYEALGVMESFFVRGTEDILEVDTSSDSHWDEDGGTIDWPRGLLTVISMAQQQLLGIESGEIPNFPWDPGIHLVGSLLHLMLVQVVPATNILHSWIFLRGIVGIYFIW